MGKSKEKSPGYCDAEWLDYNTGEWHRCAIVISLRLAQAPRHDTQEDSDAWLASLDPDARAFFKELLEGEPPVESLWDRPSRMSKETRELWKIHDNDPCPYERMIAFRRLANLPLPTESKEEWLADRAKGIERTKAKHCR